MRRGAVRPEDIVTNAEVRAICGGITRTTLLAWRQRRDFPQPVKTFAHGTNQIELWDAAAVRSWLEQHPKGRGEPRR